MNDNEINPYPDIIGKTYGKITVIEFEGFRKKGGQNIPNYITSCICNNRRHVLYHELERKGAEFCPYCRTKKLKHDERLRVLAKKADQRASARAAVIRERAKGETERQRAKAKAKAKAQAAVAKAYKIDLEHVTRMLLNDREYARTGKLLYEDGRADEAPPDKAKLDPRAAVQATMALAAAHGLVTKRSEVTVVNSVEKMRDDELIDFIEKLREKLEGYETIELNSAPELPLIEQTEPEIIGYEDED